MQIIIINQTRFCLLSATIWCCSTLLLSYRGRFFLKEQLAGARRFHILFTPSPCLDFITSAFPDIMLFRYFFLLLCMPAIGCILSTDCQALFTKRRCQSCISQQSCFLYLPTEAKFELCRLAPPQGLDNKCKKVR